MQFNLPKPLSVTAKPEAEEGNHDEFAIEKTKPVIGYETSTTSTMVQLKISVEKERLQDVGVEVPWSKFR